jgi:hypothetical protein
MLFSKCVLIMSLSWKTIFRNALTRPFAIFLYEPIIQLLGVYMAFIYGIFYRALDMLPDS